VRHPARVGLDVWPGTTHAPGAGRYARELTRALARLPSTPAMRLLDVGPGPRTLDLGPLPSAWTRVQADLPRAALNALAAVGLGAERLLGGCELFHRTLPGEPLLGDVARVQALSELPARGSDGERRLARALAGHCDVAVFSAAARAEVLRRFPLEPSRVHALPVGCDHWLRDAPPCDDLSGPPLVLALGRADRARGPLALVAALEQLQAGGVETRLVWCGRPGDAAAELRAAIASSPLGDRARWIDDPRERDLPALVARAAVLVQLRDEDWTPVTPLEAAASGAAIVASPLEAYREALGASAWWVDGPAAGPGVDRLAEALDAALGSGVEAAARARRRALASAFSWWHHAALTAALWSRILAR